MKGGKKLHSELEKINFKLDQAINSSEVNPEKIYKIACKMDKYIVKNYLKTEASSKFKKIYKTFFNKRKKTKIVNQIELDLIQRCKNITILELEILSSNIYDFCCLMVHQVSPEEIGKYITYKNNYYCKKLTNEDKNINLDNDTLKYFTELKDKYINIISNKQIN